MDLKDIKTKFLGISTWKRGDQRAPHKPLLILYTLGKIINEKERFLQYSQVKEDLRELLEEFGPPSRDYRPNYPFVRLSNDDIWRVNSTNNLDFSVDYSDKKLIDLNVSGGFTDEIYSTFLKYPTLIKDIALLILESHFPDSLHNDILSAVGLDFDILLRKKRDPNFRYRVLIAYEQKCSICGLNIRLGKKLVAIEAAHIKWHQAAGPDIEQNGLALCSLHHKLFDRGIFTLNHDLKIQISELANGTTGFDEVILKYNNKRINLPVRSEYKPKNEFVDWHNKQVFKGNARD